MTGEDVNDALGILSGSGAQPRRISGAWAFTGTRVPLYALFENLANGATIDEFVEWFPGVDEQQVQAVLEHDAKALRTALAR